MKVGTRYNSRNYAGAYYAQAKKKTGNASAPLLRLREVVHEEEAETRDARKGDRQEVTEPGDVNGIDNQQCLRLFFPTSPSLSLSVSGDYPRQIFRAQRRYKREPLFFLSRIRERAAIVARCASSRG